MRKRRVKGLFSNIPAHAEAFGHGYDFLARGMHKISGQRYMRREEPGALRAESRPDNIRNGCGGRTREGVSIRGGDIELQQSRHQYKIHFFIYQIIDPAVHDFTGIAHLRHGFCVPGFGMSGEHKIIAHFIDQFGVKRKQLVGGKRHGQTDCAFG